MTKEETKRGKEERRLRGTETRAGKIERDSASRLMMTTMTMMMTMIMMIGMSAMMGIEYCCGNGGSNVT
jgi:hypothetical protein